ncbi:hypothetical protein X943_000356 [Babesia divergens]|uniref:GRAM domain-containing protein n=1 Tax=Babesia divergens TaxID=32595 RepID=A0AAD9LGU8_BABDI|nr:hypothetical protein X943_000356 [Babesia divergens]
MAINPVLAQDIHTKQLLPYCANDEYLLMHRPQTRFSVKIGMQYLKGRGDTFLTTHRIVFIKNRDKGFSEGFSSISMPFSNLDDPRFRQPIFGSNYLEGTIRPVADAAIPLRDTGKFYICFDGGCAMFLKGFYMYYARVRNNSNAVMHAHPFSNAPETRSAFVDPDDPTHVYLTQPETVSAEDATAEGSADQNNADQENRRQVDANTAGHATTTASATIPFLL